MGMCLQQVYASPEYLGYILDFSILHRDVLCIHEIHYE